MLSKSDLLAKFEFGLNSNPPATDLGSYAKSLGISKSYCSRLFLKTVGKPFHQHRTECLVTKAVELLSSPMLSVKEISFRMGFHSPRAFSLWMKRVTGSAPGQFRAQQIGT